MAFSLTKRAKSKQHIASGGNDDASVLGEVLDRSTKTSKSKKKSKKDNKYLHPGQTVCNGDSDIDLGSQSSKSDQLIIYRTSCPCENHYDKQLVERIYELNVDKLFDLIFGDNEFVRTYRQAQRFYEDQASEWSRNEENGCRERILNYKMPFESTLVGKGTITTREKQIVLHETPSSYYVLESEVSNDGVRYSDTFSLFIRYCLVQTSATKTNLRVTAQVRFCKPMNGIIKQIIERNAYSASQEGLKDLNNRLNLISNFQMEKTRGSRTDLTLHVPSQIGERGRRMSRHDALTSLTNDQSLANNSINSLPSIISISPDRIMNYFIIILGILILFHLYLYMKLRHMEVIIENLYHMIRISTSTRQ